MMTMVMMRTMMRTISQLWWRFITFDPFSVKGRHYREQVLPQDKGILWWKKFQIFSGNPTKRENWRINMKCRRRHQNTWFFTSHAASKLFKGTFCSNSLDIFCERFWRRHLLWDILEEISFVRDIMVEISFVRDILAETKFMQKRSQYDGIGGAIHAEDIP